MIDETADISTHEHVSVCIRWVNDTLEVHEDFLGFYETGETTAEELYNIVKICHKGETCADSSDVFLFAAGRGRQPIDIRLSVMAVTRRGLPIESITGAEALVESCGDGEPQKKKRATEQSISSSRGETLGSPVYER
ncbi:UNVERIFIED_CONTAM: hypothetical protein FKN15_025766 [Acipenser sinensis]